MRIVPTEARVVYLKAAIFVNIENIGTEYDYNYY